MRYCDYPIRHMMFLAIIFSATIQTVQGYYWDTQGSPVITSDVQDGHESDLLSSLQIALARYSNKLNTITESVYATNEFVWQEIQPAGVTSYSWRSNHSCTSGQKIILGGRRLYITNDYGSSWEESQPAGDIDGIWSVIGNSFDASVILAGDYSGRLWTSSDSGTTWTERQPAGDINQQWLCGDVSSDGQTMIAGVDGGRLYVSTDGGVTWIEQQPAGDKDQSWQFSRLSRDGYTMIAGSFPGKLYTSSTRGLSWNEHEPAGPGVKPWSCGALSADGSIMLVCASGGKSYRSMDRGVSWMETEPATATNQNWKNVAMSNDAQLMVVSANPGRLFVSIDYGITWTEQLPAGDSIQFWQGLSCSANGKHIITSVDGGSVYLSYPGSIPSVATAKVIDIGMTQATSGGTIICNGDTPVTERGVCWNTIGMPTTADTITTNGTGTGTFTSTLTGLTPATTYFVRAYATCDSGTTYGCQNFFTTLAALPTVTTSEIINISTTDATGGGTVTDDGGSSVTARGICWNHSGAPTTADFTTANGAGIGLFASEISNLSAGTHYYARAYATNSAGTAYGNQKSFVTEDDTPGEGGGGGEVTTYDTNIVDESGSTEVRIAQTYAIVNNAAPNSRVVLDIDPGTGKPTVTVTNPSEDIIVEVIIDGITQGSGITIGFGQDQSTRINITDPDGNPGSELNFVGDRIPEHPKVTLGMAEDGSQVFRLGSETISQHFEITLEGDGLGSSPQVDLVLEDHGFAIAQASDNGTAGIIISGARSEVIRYVQFQNKDDGETETYLSCHDGTSLGLHFGNTMTNPFCGIVVDDETLLEIEFASDSPDMPVVLLEYDRHTETLNFGVTPDPEEAAIADVSTVAYPVILDVDEPDEDNVITVALNYSDDEIVEAGIDEKSLRLYVFDKKSSTYKFAGTTDIGESKPTGQLGDYGVSTDDNLVWAEVAELGTFVVGGSENPSPDDPSDPSDPNSNSNVNDNDNQNENTNDNVDNENTNDNTDPSPQASQPDGPILCGIIDGLCEFLLLAGMFALKIAQTRTRRR